MKGTPHVDVPLRNLARLGACALALSCFWPVAARAASTAAVGDFAGFMARVTAPNSVTVGIGTGGTFYPTTASSALGGTSGWSSAPNFGAGSTGGGLAIGQRGSVVVGGKSVPVTLSTPVTKAALADGMGILFRNAAKLAGPIGVVALLADLAPMLEQAGIQQNPNAANDPDNPFLMSVDQCANGFCTHYAIGSTGGTYYPSVQQAWSAYRATLPNSFDRGFCVSPISYSGPTFTTGYVSYTRTDSSCNWGNGNTAGTNSTTQSGAYVYNKSVPGSGTLQPANWDTVRPKYEAMNPLPSETLQKQLDWARKHAGQNGIEPYKLPLGNPTVTSPEPQLQPSTKTQTSTKTVTGPDGRPMTIETTTTTTETTPITTSGDTVKAEPKTTTTTVTKTTDADGNQTTKTESETTGTETDADPTQEPKEADLCEKYPDILACAKPELDTPDEQIPKRDISLTYSPENVLGGGGCPADKVMTVGGQQITVWDWQARCADIVNWVKPVVLALAAFISMAILVPSLRGAEI